MKTIHGAAFLAFLNKSLTLDAPAPTNISSNSEPEVWKNGTPASPAIALAKRVLPVPGAPAKSTPLGILAPKSLYFLGFLRKSTISVNSSFESSTPATSSKEVPVFLPNNILALLSPKSIILPPDACIFLIITYAKTIAAPKKSSVIISPKVTPKAGS